jgi:hypothetical protein
MISELTERELTWLIEHPEEVKRLTQFLLDGGFAIYSDNELTRQYNRAFKE